eukprot:CAMPEP_0177560364 /NCGR_PEP_ID=MMETSP0369-20130122/71339_1 /TAXON_ID=447022 ORGANISM="Scrippsiella hangoei-like, Strain SHHI-4" /NCGR_SAMPLE_ID=MMETSP0369 /ASSEMBLY_ACC=CAM_ASM_000364 /LENGTH=218 /DNA_ID=CAMNT_0019047173 /DNA_START=284 /DNA_END=936 /DNA_ORIENTATION=-
MFAHGLLIVARACLLNARGLLRAVLHEPPAQHTPGLATSSLIIWTFMSSTALHLFDLKSPLSARASALCWRCRSPSRRHLCLGLATTLAVMSSPLGSSSQPSHLCAAALHRSTRHAGGAQAHSHRSARDLSASTTSPSSTMYSTFSRPFWFTKVFKSTTYFIFTSSLVFNCAMSSGLRLCDEAELLLRIASALSFGGGCGPASSALGFARQRSLRSPG